MAMNTVIYGESTTATITTGATTKPALEQLKITSGAGHSVDGALLFRKEDTGTYTYLGEASPGTATSTAKWRIARVTNADSTILYANAGAFTATWDNRATETYS